MHTDTQTRPTGHRSRGAAYIIALVLVLTFSIVVAGSLMVVTQQLKLSKTERDYERSLQMAEAGLNVYLNKLTYGNAVGSPNAGAIPADQVVASDAIPTTSQFRSGVLAGAYTVTRYPAGSQQGYWAASIGEPSSTAEVIAYGWSNGVVRRVRGGVQATELNDDGVVDTLLTPPGDYILYPITGGTWQNSTSIRGNVGTNGALAMHNNTAVSGGGTVRLNGPQASITGHNHANMTVVNNQSGSPVDWPLVKDYALEQFPGRGLPWIETHNDNAQALVGGLPGIPSGGAVSLGNNAVVSFPGKKLSAASGGATDGGAHYFLTNFAAQNNCTVRLDNALGAITIWIGPSGGSGSFTAKNNLRIVTTSQSSAYPCKIYLATAGTLETHNNGGYAIGVYAYNTEGGQSLGNVVVKNNTAFSGSIIANHIEMQNNTVVDYRIQFFKPRGKPYYKTWSWKEF